MRNLFILFVLLFSSCASFQNSPIAALETPATLQLVITDAGILILPKVSSQSKAAIHTFAVALGALSQSQITPAAITSIWPSVSSIDSLAISGLLAILQNDLNQAFPKYGPTSAQVFQYTQAASAGLIAAGF